MKNNEKECCNCCKEHKELNEKILNKLDNIKEAIEKVGPKWVD